MSVAFWIDTLSVASRSNRSDVSTFLGILNDAFSNDESRSSPLVTAVIYNVPNRDCGASASAGELCCHQKTTTSTCDMTVENECEVGLQQYRELYIDRIAESVEEFCDKVPMTFVIEPDSVPNLITGGGNRKCGSRSTQSGYRMGVGYAVKRLKRACGGVSVYMDAAHGGWLGWNETVDGYVNEVKKMGIWRLLRGFSINVSNYNGIGEMCPEVGTCLLPSSSSLPSSCGHENNKDMKRHSCCTTTNDMCCTSSSNAGFNEANYIALLHNKLRTAIRGFSPRFVIDTGRNGGKGAQCAKTWCNVRGAGIGHRPSVKSSGLVDALLWIKPPTESDGCTERLPNGMKCERYDAMCGHEQAVGSREEEVRAPEAGELFEYQFLELMRNGGWE